MTALTKERSKAIHVYFPSGGEDRVQFDRETRRYYEEGVSAELTKEKTISIDRVLSKIREKQLAAPVTVNTVGEAFELLKTIGDMLVEQEKQFLADLEAARHERE